MSHRAEEVVLARLPSGVPVRTVVHTYEGDAPGPTVYVQAAQHGREVNGTEVLRRFDEELDTGELAGTVVAVPVADPLTFDRVSYTTPETLDSVHANMNRVWPGDPEGSLHERMAASLWRHAGGADAIVDLHTGSPDMLTHVVYTEDHDASEELAEAFGTDLLLSEEAGDRASPEWHERGFAGKLRVAAAGMDIPTITPELANSRQFDEDAIDTGLTGLFNVLRELDMLPGDPVPNGDPDYCRNHLGTVEAADSGLFRPEPDLAVGDEMAAGDPLGVLYDPTTFDVLQNAEADRDGILYDLAREATVTAGAALGGVALRHHDID